MTLFLEEIRRRSDARIDDAFPWSVPALISLERLRFSSSVTFLMGENGSGSRRSLKPSRSRLARRRSALKMQPKTRRSQAPAGSPKPS